MFKWIFDNPVKSVFITGIAGSPIIDIYLKRKAKKDLLSPIYRKLISGSKPSVLLHSNAIMIPRPHIANDLARFFLPQPETSQSMCFGVIIGPSGSGKTQAVRELSNNFPRGDLYYEITEPSGFVRSLKEMGMKLKPTIFLDLVLNYISESYCHYHVLPKCQLDGIDYTIGVLENAAMRYTKKYGEVPVLFVDGVDILTKRDAKLCHTLLTRVKILANGNKLKVVLVSSEGTIISLLKKLSAANRARVYEISDMEEQQATRYTYIKNGN